MTNQFIIPNTRSSSWKEDLLAVCEAAMYEVTEGVLKGSKEAAKVFLVEPDKLVLDYLLSKKGEYTYDNPLGNMVLVDPQHHGTDTHTSAIKMALEMDYQGDNSIFILGFKTDIDMLGAVALLAYEGPFLSERIDIIDGIDTGSFFGEWKPQVADNNVLLLNSEEISDTKLLGAMAAHSTTPLDHKVAMMANWLAGGEAPQQFKEGLLKERQQLLEATVEVLSGIKVLTCSSAGVSSLLYLDTEVAGEGRPFGLAFNPNFRGQGAKYSLLQFKNEYVDASAFFARMNELEKAEGTWGGNPNLGIGGSPLGTTLTPEVVAAELVNFLTDKGREYLIS